MLGTVHLFGLVKGGVAAEVYHAFGSADGQALEVSRPTGLI